MGATVILCTVVHHVGYWIKSQGPYIALIWIVS